MARRQWLAVRTFLATIPAVAAVGGALVDAGVLASVARHPSPLATEVREGSTSCDPVRCVRELTRVRSGHLC